MSFFDALIGAAPYVKPVVDRAVQRGDTERERLRQEAAQLLMQQRQDSNDRVTNSLKLSQGRAADALAISRNTPKAIVATRTMPDGSLVNIYRDGSYEDATPHSALSAGRTESGAPQVQVTPSAPPTKITGPTGGDIDIGAPDVTHAAQAPVAPQDTTKPPTRNFAKPPAPTKPTTTDKITARVAELTKGGMPLNKANERARLEFGQMPAQQSFSPVTVTDDTGAPVVKPFNNKSGAVGDAVGGAKPAGGGIGMAGIKKAIASNTEQVSIIDDAIAELDRHPGAVGMNRGLPLIGNAIDQRIDKGGINARAQIANIGSMVIHDRSGAAVTVHEFPRLAPFVPNVSDSREKIKANLLKLKQNIGVETNALQQQSGAAGAPPPNGSGDPEFDALMAAVKKRTTP